MSMYTPLAFHSALRTHCCCLVCAAPKATPLQNNPAFRLGGGREAAKVTDHRPTRTSCHRAGICLAMELRANEDVERSVLLDVASSMHGGILAAAAYARAGAAPGTVASRLVVLGHTQEGAGATEHRVESQSGCNGPGAATVQLLGHRDALGGAALGQLQPD